MIQHARPHPKALCTCGRPAQEVRSGTTVHLECARCDIRTAKLACAETALVDWALGHLQPITPTLRAPVTVPCALGSARSVATAERQRQCLALFEPTPRMAA